jgi:hypothetical protein
MRTTGWATLGSAILVLTDAWFDVTAAAPGVAEITALPMAACIEMLVSLVAPAGQVTGAVIAIGGKGRRVVLSGVVVAGDGVRASAAQLAGDPVG